MAQLSRLAQLFVRISQNLTEDDVRNLRALLSIEEVLGKAKVERATSLEILDMLVDNETIGSGKLGFLVQVLRSLGKGKLATETERLDQEQNMEGKQQTVEIPELESLNIMDWERLTEEAALGSTRHKSNTSGPNSGNHDDKVKLETLLAELNTPTVVGDKEQKCELYCEIGDLYRTKLHNLQTALQYYHKMSECFLPEDKKQAKAYNRLGLTYDMLIEKQDAVRYHNRALSVCRAKLKNEADIGIAYKNLASSLAILGKVPDGKTNYESALEFALKTGNKTELMDICFRLGDLHRAQLDEPQISQKYYTDMLALARGQDRKYWERLAYNRLGVACEDMQNNEEALEWHQKNLKMSLENAEKKEQLTAHRNVGNTYRRLGKVDQATSHFNTALQMAQQTGDQQGQMRVYFCMGEMQREQLHSPHTAIQYYEQYLALATQLWDRPQEGLAYNRLGVAHYAMGEYGAALEWHQKDLKIRQESGDKANLLITHKCIAHTYKALGNLDLARSHYQSAMVIAMETGNKQQQDVIAKELASL